MLLRDCIQNHSIFDLCNLEQQYQLLDKFRLHLQEDLFQRAKRKKLGLRKQQPYLQVSTNQL